MDMKRRGTTGREGAGTRKPSRLVSMVTPCWTEKVWSWAKHVFMKTVLRIMGSMRRRILVSSTWVTLQMCHGPKVYVPWAVDVIAARSKNL